MNRRSFFRALGLGAASVAATPVLAALPAEKIVEFRPKEGIALRDAMQAHSHPASAFTSNNGAHTHSLCTCYSPHTHGCAVHNDHFGGWGR